MRLLLDGNLPEFWQVELTAAGFDVVAWRSFADPRASDSEIIDWAATNECVVVTQDLDFGQPAGVLSVPSVVIVRSRKARPNQSPSELAWVLRRWEPALEQGALLVLDPDNHRVRMLPLR